jgi:uncharacterized RDD family membrane protein YckC
MKCPKCHYLSFEPSPRCRNCGFDLGIADVEVAIRPAEVAEVAEASEAPAADLELHPKRRTAPRRAPKTIGLIHPARHVEAPREPASFQEVPLRIDLEPPAVVGLSRQENVRSSAPAPQVPVSRVPIPSARVPIPSAPVPQFPSSRVAPVAPVAPPPQTPGELPLFVKGLLSGPSRPPLAVRRAAPELVRPKPAPTPPRPPGPFDADLMEDLRRMETEENDRLRTSMREQARVEVASTGEVGRMTRLAALGADWAILSALSTVILWASLRVADARVQDLSLAAILPLSAFLVLVGFAYFLMFTLGNGQTPGKMALHIRVVDVTVPDTSQPPSPKQALNRTLLAAASGVLLGIGFIPALGEHGVAAPDRFTQTRTVRA